MGKRMFTVDFENGVIVNVLAVDESDAVKIGKQKGGCVALKFGRVIQVLSHSSILKLMTTEK